MAEMDDANKSAKIQAGGVFKSAAVTILRMFGRLMTTGEITKYVIFEYAKQPVKVHPQTCAVHRTEISCRVSSV
jgi:hypothetical protein